MYFSVHFLFIGEKKTLSVNSKTPPGGGEVTKENMTITVQGAKHFRKIIKWLIASTNGDLLLSPSVSNYVWLC